MAVIRFLVFSFWVVVFLVLLLFAIKNSEPVAVQFYFDQSWEAPLVFVVLGSFAVGAVFGVIACIPPLLRQRREIVVLRKEARLRSAEAPPVALAQPTAADAPSLL